MLNINNSISLGNGGTSSGVSPLTATLEEIQAEISRFKDEASQDVSSIVGAMEGFYDALQQLETDYARKKHTCNPTNQSVIEPEDQDVVLLGMVSPAELNMQATVPEITAPMSTNTLPNTSPDMSVINPIGTARASIWLQANQIRGYQQNNIGHVTHVAEVLREFRNELNTIDREYEVMEAICTQSSVSIDPEDHELVLTGEATAETVVKTGSGKPIAEITP